MFIPKRILFEKDSLNYPVGRRIYEYFSQYKEIERIEMKSSKIKGNIPGDTMQNYYKEGKKTLVVGLKKGNVFQSCKPSAHYQLPLVSGCTGGCQYCYLNTNLGDKPYMKVNVNIDDILHQAEEYIHQRLPEETIFEGAATSDPVPIEPYTDLLKYTIEYFGRKDHAGFRFVTKFTDVDTLLDAKHNGHTQIRFTLNTNRVIQEYESRTPSMEKRIEACKKIISAGYPTGFILAPIFIYEGWKDDYKHLLDCLQRHLPADERPPLTFEVISHRYTTRAKNVIMELFPENSLPMTDEERSFKYGQFGYGKFVYPKDSIAEITSFFQSEIPAHFSDARIKYII